MVRMDTIVDRPDSSINVGFWSNEVAILLHTGPNEDAPVDPRNVVHILTPDEAVSFAQGVIAAATQALILGSAEEGMESVDEDEDDEEYYEDEEDDDQGGHDVGSDPDFGRYDEGPHD